MDNTSLRPSSIVRVVRGAKRPAGSGRNRRSRVTIRDVCDTSVLHDPAGHERPRYGRVQESCYTAPLLVSHLGKTAPEFRVSAHSGIEGSFVPVRKARLLLEIRDVARSSAHRNVFQAVVAPSLLPREPRTGDADQREDGFPPGSGCRRARAVASRFGGGASDWGLSREGECPKNAPAHRTTTSSKVSSSGRALRCAASRRFCPASERRDRTS